MTDKIHLNWFDVEVGCNKLRTDITENQLYPFHYIIGLSRGGLIPGVILSEKLDIPFIPIVYSSSKGKGVTSQSNQNRLEHIQQLLTVKQLRVLFVDDIVDTGNTLKEVVTFYSMLEHDVATAALIYKEGAVIKPTHSAITIEPDSAWYVFPWEV